MIDSGDVALPSTAADAGASYAANSLVQHQPQIAVAPTGNQLRCRVCGVGPAVKATFRRHTGMLMVMRFGSLGGPFCADCGLAVFRHQTAHTLVAGWWGMFSFFITPFVLLWNLVQLRRVVRLPKPTEARRYMSPGKPLYRRPEILGLLVPLLVVGVFIGVSATSKSPSEVGRCVSLSTDGQSAELVSCGLPHNAVVTKVVDVADDCPADTVAAGSFSGGYDDSIYCFGPAD